MEPSQLVVPAVLGAGAVATGLARRQQARRLATLLDARSTSVAELKDLQATVAEQMGAGSFRERVKLQGTIACNEPLTAPWSGEPCVAFTNTTTAHGLVRHAPAALPALLRPGAGDGGHAAAQLRWPAAVFGDLCLLGRLDTKAAAVYDAGLRHLGVHGLFVLLCGLRARPRRARE